MSPAPIVLVGGGLAPGTAVRERDAIDVRELVGTRPGEAALRS